MRLRRAFTLIEMLAVIVVIAMVAAIAFPRLVAFLKSEQKRDFLANLERMPLRASQEAISTGQTIEMVTSEGGAIELRTVDTNGSDGRIMASLAAPDGLEVSRYRSGNEEVGYGDWRLHFFPDGSSDTGGLEVTEGNETWYLLLDPKSGRGSVGRGALPLIEDQRWEAGEHVQRS